VSRSETIFDRFCTGDFLASGGGEVEGVEKKHNVAFAQEVLEVHGSAQMVFQLKVGAFFSDLDHCGSYTF
jgi:hypothetical protein